VFVKNKRINKTNHPIMRAKTINEMTYQRMSVEEFVNWYENLVQKHPNLHWYNILSSLENDENSTQGELYDYFISDLQIDDIPLIEDILEKREYFLDFTYAQHIDAN